MDSQHKGFDVIYYNGFDQARVSDIWSTWESDLMDSENKIWWDILQWIRCVGVTFDKIWSSVCEWHLIWFDQVKFWWTRETGEFKLIPAANPVKLMPYAKISTKIPKKEKKDASFILLLYFDTSKSELNIKWHT